MNTRISAGTLLCGISILVLLVFSGCASELSKTQGGSPSSDVPATLGNIWYQCGVSNDNFISVADTGNEFIADGQVHSFAGGFGVSGLPHCISDCLRMTNAPSFPTNSSQILAYLVTKNVSTIQNFLENRVMTRIDRILAKLQLLESENAIIVFDIGKLYSLLIGADQSNTNFVRIDPVEFYAADVALSGLAGMICLLNAQNLDINVANLINMISNMSISTNFPPSGLNSFFYNPFSSATFGTVRGIYYYASAKSYLNRMANKSLDFLTAYDLYRAASITGTNILIPTGMPSNVHSMVDYIANWMKTSLGGTSVAFDMTTVITNISYGSTTNTNVITNNMNTYGIKINLGRAMDNAPSLRNMLINLDGSGDPVFYTTNDFPTQTTPVDNDAYCFRLADTNMNLGGLLDGDVYSVLTNSGLTNTGFTNVLNTVQGILKDGGYIRFGMPVSNTIFYIPYTNAGYTSQWLNLWMSINNLD